MTDAPIVPFALTGRMVPVTVDSFLPDNSLPNDIRGYTLTLDDGNAADPTRRIYEQVMIYQPSVERPNDPELDRAMREHVPPLERHMIPIGNHYEAAYMSNNDWSRYQEAYTRLLAAQDQAVRTHSLMSDLGVVPPANPLFRGAQTFNSIMFTNDFDVPTPALGHLRRVDIAIPGRDGGFFDSRGFVATNPSAEEFLRSRGYVQVGMREEGGRPCPFFLPPLDAQFYQSATA